MKVNIHKLRTIAHWLLFLVILIYIVTGLGIMKYQIVGPLTFGLLTKALSTRIHNSILILIAFLILLILHLYFALKPRKK